MSAFLHPVVQRVSTVAILLSIWTSSPLAQTAMVDLGTLGGSNSNAFGVSADGLIVIGQSQNEFGFEEAFRWTATEGMTRLSGLPTDKGSIARAISGNGQVIVGTIYSVLEPAIEDTPFRWSEAVGLETLQKLTGYDGHDPTRTNFDGTIAVGEAYIRDQENSERAVRWASDGSILDLGTLSGDSYSGARDVSDDGTIIIGTSYSASGVARSFKWTQAAGMLDLGLPAGAEARVISGDGRILAGTSEYDALDADGEKLYFAVRWTSDGSMEELGSLPGADFSGVGDINYDGSVIVGESGVAGSISDNYKIAFRWTEAGGMESLGVLEGHLSSEADAVSADGSVVVGTSYAADYERAFIWRGAIQDYENLIYSFTQMTDATEVALQQNSDLLDNSLSATCSVESGYSYCLKLTGGAQTSDSVAEGGGWDDEAQGFGTIAVGLGATDHLTIGAMLISYTGTDADFVEWESPALGAGAYLQFSHTGDYLTGFNAGMRAGISDSDMTFIRGSSLADVQVSNSDASVQSHVAAAEASYGFAINEKWVASPLVRLKWAQSTRDGYSEDGDLAFSAEYDRATEESLSLAFGLDQRFFMNEQNAIRLGVGAETDLQYTNPEISGTSNLPGMDSFEFTPDLERNDWRGFADIEHQFLFGPEQMLSTRVYLESPTYGSDPIIGGNASLRLSF